MLRDAAAALIPFTDATLQLLFILSKTFLLHSLVCRGALFIISLLFFSFFFARARMVQMFCSECTCVNEFI